MRRAAVLECTLLDLVQAIGDVIADDRVVVAIVLQLIESGRVRVGERCRADRSRYALA